MSNTDHLGLNQSPTIGRIKLFLQSKKYSTVLCLLRKIFRFYKKLKISTVYFANSKKINTVIKLCEDQISKDVVCTQLGFIKNYDYTDEQGYLIKNNLFERHSKLLNKDEYFPEDIISLSDNEGFVDGGGFDGDTINEFYLKTQGVFNHIFSFEPDQKNLIKLNETINKLNIPANKINAYDYGLLDCKKEINFTERGIGSYISKKGTNKIKVISLDNFLDNESKKKITFIKLDIEGSEIEALNGMKNIIKQNKPKLAICVYHKPEHFWQIPLLIKKINPDYKIYFRQHALSRLETVCYAI